MDNITTMKNLETFDDTSLLDNLKYFFVDRDNSKPITKVMFVEVAQSLVLRFHEVTWSVSHNNPNKAAEPDEVLG